jgi:hypothetical protein
MVTTGTGAIERHFFIANFDGTEERPLGGPVPRRAYWADSENVVVGTETPAGVHVALVNARTQAVGRTIDLPDSLARQVQPFSGGWLWIASSRDKVVIDRDGKQTEIAKPKDASAVLDVAIDASGTRLAMTAYGLMSSDTIYVYEGPVSGGPLMRWLALHSEGAFGQFARDGSILLTTYPAADNVSFYRLRGPGQVESIGTVDRPVYDVSASLDLKRAAVTVLDYHGDTWLSRVVRP